MKRHYVYKKIKIGLFIFWNSWSNLIYAQTNLNCPEEMIAYWKFDETSGSNTFKDIFGENDASCVVPYCPHTDLGMLNGALNFNNCKVIVDNPSAFNWDPGSSFSVEAWIRTTQQDSGRKVFTGKHRGGSQMAWWLGISENNKAMFFVRDSDSITAFAEGIRIISDGNWHHIIGLKDGSLNILQIFVDGEKENEVSTSYAGHFNGSGPLFIGYYIDAYYYSGLLDELAIYNQALNVNQILLNQSNIVEGKSYCNTSTGVTFEEDAPSDYFLDQNYPNPFNSSTIIKYNIPQKSFAILKVFDLLGNEISELVNEEKQAGIYEAEFKMQNISSGIYIYKLQTDNYTQIKKMVLLK